MRAVPDSHDEVADTPESVTVPVDERPVDHAGEVNELSRHRHAPSDSSWAPPLATVGRYEARSIDKTTTHHLTRVVAEPAAAGWVVRQAEDLVVGVKERLGQQLGHVVTAAE
jgi:hypothetical protein